MPVDYGWTTRVDDGRLAAAITEQLVKESAETSDPVNVVKLYETAYTVVRIARRMGWGPTKEG